MRKTSLILAFIIISVGFCRAEGPPPEAGRSEIIYYVAVDTPNWTQVEKALQDLQSRFGIRYRPATAGEIAPSNPTPQAAPFSLHIDRKTRAKGRIPKTEREFSELTTAARENPAACYAWIYGQDSPIFKQMQGHSWADLGDDDGVAQCRAEASRVRNTQSLLGF